VLTAPVSSGWNFQAQCMSSCTRSISHELISTQTTTSQSSTSSLACHGSSECGGSIRGEWRCFTACCTSWMCKPSTHDSGQLLPVIKQVGHRVRLYLHGRAPCSALRHSHQAFLLGAASARHCDSGPHLLIRGTGSGASHASAKTCVYPAVVVLNLDRIIYGSMTSSDEHDSCRVSGA
jgi:hypothetical protein